MNVGEIDTQEGGRKIDANPFEGTENAYLRLINQNRQMPLVYNHKARYCSELNYEIYSLLGCSLAVVYNIGKKKLISFCVDTGFTCFGLVEQNYELPEDVLQEMGVHYIPVPRTEVQRTDVNRTSTAVQINTSDYETIDITVLRRGVIGVNRIGYVIA